MVGRVLAAMATVALAGCTGPLVGNRDWLEVRSANFSLYTTLDESRARALLEDLELFRSAILTVTRVHSVHPHVPTEIYAFRSESDYRPFQPRDGTRGFFRPTLRINFVALSAGEDAR